MKCLCCGFEMPEPRTGTMTEAQMRNGLHRLVAIGYTVQQLTTDPACIESLNWTSPGFVDWLKHRALPC